MDVKHPVWQLLPISINFSGFSNLIFEAYSVPGTPAGGGGGGGYWLVNACYYTVWSTLCHCYTTSSIRSFTAFSAVIINANT